MKIRQDLLYMTWILSFRLLLLVYIICFGFYEYFKILIDLCYRLWQQTFMNCYFSGKDEHMIGVSLGYTCHLLLMISNILDIPLRYSMTHLVSKSIIHDHIHTKLEDKERE